MKVTKLVTIIAITIMVATIAGCEETVVLELVARVDASTLAELKDEPNGGSAPTLTDEAKQKILDFPGPGASAEEFDRHAELVKSVAVDSDTLDLAGCEPNPLVLEVGHGESIAIRNPDKVDYILYHGKQRITIPTGETKNVVITHFLGSGEERVGFAGYACGYNGDVGTFHNAGAGIFYVNPDTAFFEQRHILLRVVEIILPERSPGIEGVKVTPLEGSDEREKGTVADGSVTFIGQLPLTVMLEKEGYPAREVTVFKDNEEVLFTGGKREVSVRVVEPLLPSLRNGPGIEGVTVTCLEGSDEGVKTTDADGRATFFGNLPLTIRIEKPGYITTEVVMDREEEIVFPNEWPEEAKGVIHKLGLTELVAARGIILRWGENDFLREMNLKLAGTDKGLGAWLDCPVLLIRDSPFSHNKLIARREKLAALCHEITHVWIGLRALGRPCGPQNEKWITDADWVNCKEGAAWVAAMEKDFKEIGPMPEDDRLYGVFKKPLKELSRHSLANFFVSWYMGDPNDGTKEELDKLYREAPNRCQYMEDHFLGPPPPRQ